MSHEIGNDRLEQALEAMRSESLADAELAAARTRVWERLVAAGAAACAEFQPKLQDYYEGRLPQSRRLLMEDHLGRCAECRREFAVLKGERAMVTAMPSTTGFWTRWKTWAAVAAMVLAVLYLGRHRVDSMLAPGGPRLTVASVSGELHKVPEGVLQANAALGEGEILRTGPGSRAVVRLSDGSTVEVNERSELYVKAAWSGSTIHLERGDIIVQAAKQRNGSLRVETRDSLASVKGTVFAVSAGVTGSVVSVVEGSVEVRQPGGQKVLSRGEQAVSNPAVEGVTVREAVSWSQDREKYLELLGEFAKIEKQVAALEQPAPRTQSKLLAYLPPNAMVYMAMPNVGGTIGRAIGLANERAGENETFREWWESKSANEIREVAERIRSVSPLLGDEIVFVLSRSDQAVQQPSGFAAGQPGERKRTVAGKIHRAAIPMLMAEVQPGKREALLKALETLHTEDGVKPAFHVTDQFMVVSDNAQHLQWLILTAGQGAASPFGAAIAQRYQRGAGWLLAVDVEPVLPGTIVPEQKLDASVEQHHKAAMEASGASHMKHLFFEMRTGPGGQENEATMTFDGPRTGIASWLATSGTSGAAEYISSDAMFAFAASTREPRQVFDEFVAQMSKISPSFGQHLQEMQTKLGINVAEDIASAVGTDFAVAVERPTLPVPGWIAAVLVYRPASLDETIKKLVEASNNELKPGDDTKRLVFTQETDGGRVWNTVGAPGIVGKVVSFTWTYDRGYMVAGADRSLVTRAIDTRSGGFPLVWSPAFRAQLPAAAGLHPSGFAWVNTGPTLQAVAALVPQQSLKSILNDREPVLVVVNGETEQIRASSRTRLTSLILDLMMADAVQKRGENLTTDERR